MRRLFAPLAALFGYTPRPPALHDPLLGLSPEEARSLASLKDHPAWHAYLSTLDTVVNLYAESLLQSRDDAALHETRGVILGLRKAVSLVDETLHRTDELSRQQRQRERLAADESERRTRAFYGSPVWDATGFPS